MRQHGSTLFTTASWPMHKNKVNAQGATEPLETFLLNSFVRRCSAADQLKTTIKQSGASLTRKGRSRNWLLIITPSQKKHLCSAIYQANQPSWLWLIKRLNDSAAPACASDIKQAALDNPGITVSQLVNLTSCTLAEARNVLDEIEWRD